MGEPYDVADESGSDGKFARAAISDARQSATDTSIIMEFLCDSPVSAKLIHRPHPHQQLQPILVFIGYLYSLTENLQSKNYTFPFLLLEQKKNRIKLRR